MGLELIKGKAWIFGDEIDTGQIIPGRYVPLYDPNELSKHVFEDILPNFTSDIEYGDMIVGGENFGCGSSREHAPKAIKHAGISAVIAESFARIFYRNSINLGLYVITIPNVSKEVDQGDTLILDIENSKLYNETKNKNYTFNPYKDFLIDIINSGGIINYTVDKLKKEGRI